MSDIKEKTSGFGALEAGAMASMILNPPAPDPARGATFAAWASAEVLGVIGALLPGAECRAQSLRFDEPPGLGEALTLTLDVGERNDKEGTARVHCLAVDPWGRRVLEGTVTVRPPARMAASILDRNELAPEVSFHNHRRTEQLVAWCRERDPLPAAVVYPLDAAALSASVEAARARVITPTLVGPTRAIRSAAAEAGIDISGLPLVEVADEADAATAAVAMARAGEARVLMKGSLHTNVLLHAVLARESGLRRAEWVSHVFVFDVPAYPKPLLVTDAVVAVAPTLSQKAVICRNAIAVAHALGVARPKVAVLSATEDVDPAIPSSVDAAALGKMAERGQISGAVIDGPLAMDNAISAASARTKGIVSPVAGSADILVVPTVEAGNILYKNLTYLAGADAAGVVVGAAVPIILASRSDNVRTRIASAALANMVAARTERGLDG
jgi:phosphate acetyltransferase